jgi:hypothetical protein
MRSARFASSAGYRGSSAHCQPSPTSLLWAISTINLPESSNTPRQLGGPPMLNRPPPNASLMCGIETPVISFRSKAA